MKKKETESMKERIILILCLDTVNLEHSVTIGRECSATFKTSSYAKVNSITRNRGTIIATTGRALRFVFLIMIAFFKVFKHLSSP